MKVSSFHFQTCFSKRFSNELGHALSFYHKKIHGTCHVSHVTCLIKSEWPFLPLRTSKSTGRYQVANFMVTTGIIAWSDSGDKPHAEEMVLPPLQLERTGSSYIIRGLVKCFGFIGSLDQLLEKGTKEFDLIQVQCVCDAASANMKALPRLFTWLQAKSEHCVSTMSPCLLHQLSRVLLMNLERQMVSSHLVVWLNTIAAPHLFVFVASFDLLSLPTHSVPYITGLLD